jgi:hypothetical protein
MALAEGARPAQDPGRAPGGAGAARDVDGGALAWGRRGKVGQPPVCCAEHGALGARPGEAALHAADLSAEAGERLEHAIALYRGDFLEEDAYDEWAGPLREEARAVHADVAHTLAEDAAAAGRYDEAAGYSLRVLDRDRYDERAHLGLVTSLVARGRHGEARRAYRAYCRRMDEIEVESAPFPVRV